MFYTIESSEREVVVLVEGAPVLRCAVTEAALESVLQFIELLRAPLCIDERRDPKAKDNTA